MLFDSHAHINNESFDEEEREALIAKIEASKVDYVMDIGFNPESSELAVKHANRLSWCYAAVGCHPHDTKDMDEEKLDRLRELAQEEKVRAIGEIGLDFYYDYSDRDAQRYWFRRQIQLANEQKNAYCDPRQGSGSGSNGYPQRRGCFFRRTEKLVSAEIRWEWRRPGAASLFLRQQRTGTAVCKAGRDYFRGRSGDL